MIKTQQFFAINGIKYDMLDKDLKGRYGKLTGQYDIVLFNTDHIFIVEVKRKAHVNDIDKVLQLKASFPKIFPQYSDFTFHLGLASENFYDDVITEAKVQGIYLLQEEAGAVEII